MPDPGLAIIGSLNNISSLLSRFRPLLPTCICDDYDVDVKNHGRPHIDRVDKNGKLVGRYRPDGTGIKHKGKTPPRIPRKDREAFGKAAEKVRQLEAEMAKNTMDDILSQHPVPQPSPPEYELPYEPPQYSPCAGGPCDPVPVYPLFGPAPGTPNMKMPEFNLSPRFFPDVVFG